MGFRASLAAPQRTLAFSATSGLRDFSAPGGPPFLRFGQPPTFAARRNACPSSPAMAGAVRVIEVLQERMRSSTGHGMPVTDYHFAPRRKHAMTGRHPPAPDRGRFLRRNDHLERRRPAGRQERAEPIRTVRRLPGQSGLRRRLDEPRPRLTGLRNRPPAAAPPEGRPGLAPPPENTPRSRPETPEPALRGRKTPANPPIGSPRRRPDPGNRRKSRLRGLSLSGLRNAG